MSADCGPGSGDEYPQAIADDYPGWGIEHQDGQWTAWCPAITVHAATAAGLRAAIEHTIAGDQPDLPGAWVRGRLAMTTDQERRKADA